MPKHPLQKNILQIKNVTLVLTVLVTFNTTFSQNSIVGDGFGGRLWYRPYNYTIGSYSAYTICGDTNQLFGWGGNEYGQLGDGTNTGHATPTRVIGMTNVKYYSTGYLMGAIKFDKSGWVWGHLAGNKPIKILDQVKFLDAGMDVCTFIKTDGTVWSVGSNKSGSFGNGLVNETTTLIPQQMTGITNAVRIANSGSNNTILLSDGTVMQAGLNFNFSKTLKPQKINGLNHIVDIKANQNNVIALDKNGDVFVWGEGRNGSNGNGNTFDVKSPQKILGLSHIVAISGCNDGDHFLALDSNQNCYAWGFCGYGQCGTSESTLLRPTLIATEVNDILAGERFSYIIKTNGELWASGMSKDGSIWMNINNTIRYKFTKINPRIPPIELCEPMPVQTFLHRDYQIRLCPGDSFRVGSNYHKNAGHFIDTVMSAIGLDTIIFTQINFNKVSSSFQTKLICPGNYFSVGNHQYYKAGLYLDTFNNQNGCDSIVTTEIRILPVSQIYKTVSICKGETIKIEANTFSDAGIYIDTFKNIFGCDSIISTTLVVNQRPIADFNFSTDIIETGDTFQLINLCDGANEYNWLLDSHIGAISNDVSPLFHFTSRGQKEIQLIARNNISNCHDTVQKHVMIRDNESVFIPNAFHPDGDGYNDYFRPISKSYKDITFRIFNRWGVLLFETNQYGEGWNGQYENINCPQDVYMYTIEMRSSFFKDVKFFSGTLTLLR